MSRAEPTETVETAEPATLDHEVVIAPDDVTDDGESERDSLASSSTSVAASILGYRQENGRTYHKYKDGKYGMPNDERESDRLDLQHNLFLLTFNERLGNAPPNDPGAKVGRVLDVGTGTGIWAIDFGDEHPESEVLGFDLSSALPQFTPPNVKFEVDDLEEPWTYSRPFDYIHSRMLSGCVADWDVYVKKMFDNLSPGGYAELIEVSGLFPQSDDGTLKEDAKVLQVAKLVEDAARDFGRLIIDPRTLPGALKRAGFVDVKIMQFKWPTNTWPRDKRYKEIALWSCENIVTGWEALCLTVLTRRCGWTQEEVMVAMMQCRKEFKDRNIHAYYPIYSVFGRKPTKEEESK